MIVNSIVIKVASRCNLNCSYCYVYNLGDTTYLSQPKLMSDKDVKTLIKRVSDHCQEKNIKTFQFIFHGGEPMLQKKEFYIHFVNYANEVLSKDNIECIYTIQTNGLLISEDWCKLFNQLKIQVGVSLDGYKEINDKYRVDHKGKGSYDRVIAGLKIAQNNLDKKPGVLSVIDIESDPIRFYENIKGINVDFFDLLWPHANHDKPPKDYLEIKKETPYADWLIKIFDIWFAEKHKDKKTITLFDTFINLIIGNKLSGNEDFGREDNGLLVIETNGDIEVVGALKLCGNGFTKNDSNINKNSFSEALETKLANVYYKSHKLLNKKCLNCPLLEICGGGHIHTRYKKDKGFDNPSIYCNDYIKLITHIQNTIYDSLPEKYKEGSDKITFQEVIDYLDNLELNKIEAPVYTDALTSF